jgi:hypothetical protein
MYPTVKLIGLRNAELLVHLHRQDEVNADMVELYHPGGDPVSLNREQFDSMVAWVHQQFDVLAQKGAPTVH